MSEADDSVMKEVLGRTRRGWSPNAEDVDRVRRGLEAQLASSGTGAPVQQRVPRLHGRWRERLLLAGTFAAAGVAVGYWAGRRAERRHHEQPTAVSTRAGLTAEAPPKGVSDPSPHVEGPIVATPAAPSSPARRAPSARRRPPEAPPPTSAESLAAEVQALRNAERALRDRNPGLALAFLDALDRDVPGGQMREERAAIRAIARCTAGDQPFGVNLADEFDTAYPSSAYRARVEQACAEESRSEGE